jgi:cell division GTPase FtsZ
MRVGKGVFDPNYRRFRRNKEDESMDVPKIPLEDFKVPSSEYASELDIKNEYEGALEFGVIGAGQCGGRIVKSFYDIGYKKSIAINTAVSDLNPLDIPENQKLKIGGEGSGKDMEKGEKAAAEGYQRIFDKMKQVFGTVDKIIVSVGFGGGTGAGGLRTVIEVAQKYLEFLGSKNPKTDVIVIAALPTGGELSSKLIKENTEKIADTMFKAAKVAAVGPILLIDNSKIERLYRGIPPKQFWTTINDTITGLFQMFNYLATQESGYTTFDAEDYKALLKTPGLAVLGVTSVDLAETKLSQALQDNFKKTLLASRVDYNTAQKAACIVCADNATMESVPMDEFNYGFDTIAHLIGNATVYRGLYEIESPGVRAYTMISGLVNA